MKIRFIKDGSEGKKSKWRYKKDEEVLLPDYLAKEAIEEELAIQIDPNSGRSLHQNAMNPAAIAALNKAKGET